MYYPAMTSMVRGIFFGTLCLLAWQVFSAEDEQSIVVRAIDVTPSALVESGICLEGRRNFSDLHLTINIPVTNSAGKVTDFYMKVMQGPGRDTTTSTLLSEYNGKWAPPIYTNLWGLDNMEYQVDMQVGFKDAKTRNVTRYRFRSARLKQLLGLDDDDKLYRAGCGRWDLENAGEVAGKSDLMK